MMAGRPLNSTLSFCMGCLKLITRNKKDSGQRAPTGPGLEKVVADCWELVSYHSPYILLTHSDTWRRAEPSQG